MISAPSAPAGQAAQTAPPPFVQPREADASKMTKKKPMTPTFLGSGDMPGPAQTGAKTLLGQ